MYLEVQGSYNQAITVLTTYKPVITWQTLLEGLISGLDYTLVITIPWASKYRSSVPHRLYCVVFAVSDIVVDVLVPDSISHAALPPPSSKKAQQRAGCEACKQIARTVYHTKDVSSNLRRSLSASVA